MICCAGTTAAYRTHQRHGTEPCPEAREARNAYWREWRSKNLERRRVYNAQWMWEKRNGLTPHPNPKVTIGLDCQVCGEDLTTVALDHACRVSA